MKETTAETTNPMPTQSPTTPRALSGCAASLSTPLLTNIKPMPAAAPMKGRGGAEQKAAPRYSLSRGRVRYVGEPVALVVAQTAAQAQDAAEAIMVDARELPAVVTAQQALAAGAPQK